MLVHTLNDRVQIFLRLYLQNIVRIVFHSFFLLIDWFEKISYLLDANFIFVLNRLDHSWLQQLWHSISQTLKAFNVSCQHLIFTAERRSLYTFFDYLHKRDTLLCEMGGHLQAFKTPIAILAAVIRLKCLGNHFDAASQFNYVCVEIQGALRLILSLF